MIKCDNPLCDRVAVMPVTRDGGERVGHVCCHACAHVVRGEQKTLP